MDYKRIISNMENNQYLISMTPAERLVEIGLAAGMNASSTVLDLCCGYGEMLKIWHEAFDIRGVGVDLSEEFITTGKKRLLDTGITEIELLQDDVLAFETEDKFDFVCLSGEEFGGLQHTIHLLEKYVKPSGKLIIGTRYSETENPPEELTEFEGELLSLMQINEIVRANGYFMTAMATDTHAEWERYIMWSARRHLKSLRSHPDDPTKLAWCDKWYEMYFQYRRPFERYVTFVIEKQ